MQLCSPGQLQKSGHQLAQSKTPKGTWTILCCRAPRSFKGAPSTPSWCFTGYFLPLFVNWDGITPPSELPAINKTWVKTQSLILSEVFGFWLKCTQLLTTDKMQKLWLRCSFVLYCVDTNVWSQWKTSCKCLCKEADTQAVYVSCLTALQSWTRLNSKEKSCLLF